MKRALVKGFKFGILLQLAVGPVCLYIFNIGVNEDVLSAEIGILAVILVDAFFMALAALGLAAFLENERIKAVINYFGAAIIAFFGLHLILRGFAVDIIPEMGLLATTGSSSTFVQAAILTASNPLTLLLWAGVFSAKIAQDKLSLNEAGAFGSGMLLSDYIFLNIIAFLGCFTGTLLNSIAIAVLNIIVGLFLIYLAVTKFIADCTVSIENEK